MSKQWQQKGNKAAAQTPKNKPTVIKPAGENLWASMYSTPAPEAQSQPAKTMNAKNSKEFKPNSSTQLKKTQSSIEDDAIVSIEESKPPTFSNKNKQNKKKGPDALDGFTGDAK